MTDVQKTDPRNSSPATGLDLSPEPLKREQSERVATGLKNLLATTYDVYLRTQWAHWNVTGPNFASLHELFESHYDELSEAIDVIAERVRILGSPAPGSFSEFGALTRLDDRTDSGTASGMVEELVLSNERTADFVRALIPIAEEARDEGTIDLLGARIRAHEKAAWMLRSVLDRV